MGKNDHLSNPPLTDNQDNAISDDPGDGRRVTDQAGPDGVTVTDTKKRLHDQQHQATIEEFGREGLGIAAKE